MRGLFASRGVVAVAASVSALLIVGGGYAIASGGGGSIHACAKKSNGALRLAHRCRKSEHGVTWNIQGPAGSPGSRGAPGATGATGPQGPPGTQYAWSSFTYPYQARPQSDGHVATFTFTAPASGFALVTAEFQVRVHNNGSNDCHIESQLATAPAVIGTVQPTQGSAGFVDEWVNSGLPTESGGGTYLGQNMSVSRVFSVTAGSNTIYLNGQYNGYGASGANCADALWGPITISGVFANQNPSSSVTAP